MDKELIKQQVLQATKTVAVSVAVATVAKALQGLDTGDRQIVLFTARK